MTVRLVSMDAALELLLDEVTEDTKQVLVEEGITSKRVFSSLREEHFEKLLPKLKVGQHALLLRIWDRQNSWRSSGVWCMPSDNEIG